MITIVQIAFGILMAIAALGLLAVPGFLVGGAVGLLLGRPTGPSKGAISKAIAVWVILCLAATAAAVVQTEGASTHDSLDPLAELFFVMVGVGSALGGGCGLYTVMSRAKSA